jgi:hypothetical protein
MAKPTDKIAITEIVLQMGPTKVSMSLEDAEKVFQVLEKLFGRKTEYVPYYSRPYQWWYEPYWGTLKCSGLNDGSVNITNGTSEWQIGKNLNVANNALHMSIDNVNATVL